ncbi:hypothetical protein GE118_00415 [Mycoplasma sp. NEAQ87857]|uniref:hypothetical protein n=1 Tax=Mycoplasma sp. NEAQ87857 TaxID=2683967 RepID=UPI001319870F|nr:hypothetical protein [Mycoplasma sp. NEAQ87857]QGZ97267.1 hypothetical protein GE118_00415 [Mycoplasma sp. NEAQ87857]
MIIKTIIKQLKYKLNSYQNQKHNIQTYFISLVLDYKMYKKLNLRSINYSKLLLIYLFQQKELIKLFNKSKKQNTEFINLFPKLKNLKIINFKVKSIVANQKEVKVCINLKAIKYLFNKLDNLTINNQQLLKQLLIEHINLFFIKQINQLSSFVIIDENLKLYKKYLLSTIKQLNNESFLET